MNSYSFKTSVGWITIQSSGSKLVSVKFGKLKKYNTSKYLKIFLNKLDYLLLVNCKNLK